MLTKVHGHKKISHQFGTVSKRLRGWRGRDDRSGGLGPWGRWRW